MGFIHATEHTFYTQPKLSLSLESGCVCKVFQWKSGYDNSILPGKEKKREKDVQEVERQKLSSKLQFSNLFCFDVVGVCLKHKVDQQGKTGSTTDRC